MRGPEGEEMAGGETFEGDEVATPARLNASWISSSVSPFFRKKASFWVLGDD